MTAEQLESLIGPGNSLTENVPQSLSDTDSSTGTNTDTDTEDTCFIDLRDSDSTDDSIDNENEGRSKKYSSSSMAAIAKLLEHYESIAKQVSSIEIDDVKKQKALQSSVDFFRSALIAQWNKHCISKKLAADPQVKHNQKAHGTSQADSESPVNFNGLNEDIRLFIMSDAKSFACRPMFSPVIRKFVHELAMTYSLKTQSQGKGANRHVVIRKTKNTDYSDELIQPTRKLKKKRDRILEDATKCQYKIAPDPCSIRRIEKRESRDKEKSRKKETSRKSSGSSTGLIPGKPVGHTAAPIQESNIGNVLLRKIGWNPGSGLGITGDGIVDPIQAFIRRRNAGIGT